MNPALTRLGLTCLIASGCGGAASGVGGDPATTNDNNAPSANSSGTAASGSGVSTSASSVGGPRFDGAGTVAGFPLGHGFGPGTADDCPPVDGISTTPAEQVRAEATLCFYEEEDKTTPAATIEQVIEVVDDVEYIHVRVTFNPDFVDNTYGAGSVGWGDGGADAGPLPVQPLPPAPPDKKDKKGEQKGEHQFKQLVGSDHVELLLTACSGETVMQLNVDYISEDPASPSGYSTLGVSGGDGKVIVGDENAVLAVATSFDRNLNGCGYGQYTTDSPLTDESYTPNPDAPEWDYRVVYELWLAASAFEGCFGQAYVESVHASPSKSDDNTLLVEPGPCPPDWDVPYCPPSVVEEGGNCAPPGDDGPCPPNTTPLASDTCAEACVPTPFAGHQDRAPCPAGYVLDLESEGQYCLPENGSCP